MSALLNQSRDIKSYERNVNVRANFLNEFALSYNIISKNQSHNAVCYYCDNVIMIVQCSLTSAHISINSSSLTF